MAGGSIILMLPGCDTAVGGTIKGYQFQSPGWTFVHDEKMDGYFQTSSQNEWKFVDNGFQTQTNKSLRVQLPHVWLLPVDCKKLIQQDKLSFIVFWSYKYNSFILNQSVSWLFSNLVYLSCFELFWLRLANQSWKDNYQSYHWDR